MTAEIIPFRRGPRDLTRWAAAEADRSAIRPRPPGLSRAERAAVVSMCASFTVACWAVAFVAGVEAWKAMWR